MNITEKKKVEAIRARIHRLVDERKVAVSAIALRSGVEQGTVKALYDQKSFEKRTIGEATARKLEKGLDSLESSAGLVKRCPSCGKELPIGRFYADKHAAGGVRSACKECVKAQAKNRKAGKQKKPTAKHAEERKMNNNTENAMTAEMVKRVKAEDKPEVESKFMAPYFKLTQKQLDEVRAGEWDKLLLTPEKPKRAESVLSAVEALREEVAALRREVEAALVEMGCEIA